LVDARDRLHESAVYRELVHPVGERRGERPELADEVGVAEHPVLEAEAGLARVGGPGPQHQPRKVDLPAVRGRVRAVIEAELALIAEIDHFLDVGRRQLVDVAVDRLHVHAIEQHLERRTQRQAPPAPAANVIDPPQLLVDRTKIPELRPPDIERRHVMSLYARIYANADCVKEPLTRLAIVRAPGSRPPPPPRPPGARRS